MFFKKKKPKESVKNPIKYFQVIEEVPIYYQDFKLIFDDGNIIERNIVEYAKDFSHQPYPGPVMGIERLFILRDEIINAILNGNFLTLHGHTSKPEIIKVKGVKSLTFSEPKKMGTEYTVYWTEEEGE